DERTRRWHRAAEEEGAHRQEDADDRARREHPDAGVARRLKVIDGAGAELDRERNRSLLGELVPVEAQSEPRGPARLEVAASLVDVEGPSSRKTSAATASRAACGSTSASANSRYAAALLNSGGTACAPSQVAIPPASRIARSEASSVSWSSP